MARRWRWSALSTARRCRWCAGCCLGIGGGVRRLTLLLVGVAVAFYGFNLIAGAGEAAAYVLRDGLLAALVGALIFAFHAEALVRPALRLGRTWPGIGQLLFA